MPNNTLHAYKALQMSYKSYYYQKEPLNKKPLNKSKLAKMEKPKKTEKNRKKPKKNRKKPKKTSPKFEICGSVRFFFGLQPPHINFDLTCGGPISEKCDILPKNLAFSLILKILTFLTWNPPPNLKISIKLRRLNTTVIS